MFWSRSLITRPVHQKLTSAATTVVLGAVSASSPSSPSSSVLVTSVKSNRTTVVSDHGDDSQEGSSSLSNSMVSMSHHEANEIVLENVEETSYLSAANATVSGSSSSSSVSTSTFTWSLSVSSATTASNGHQSLTPSQNFIDCPSLDPYARAKITNFLKRITKATGFRAMSVPSSGFGGNGKTNSSNHNNNNNDNNDINNGEGQHQRQRQPSNQQSQSTHQGAFETIQLGPEVFRTRMILPLPPQFGLRIAEGEAGNQKDSETLAAMHASQILDELGFQLYTLASMQKKHAMQVRSSSMGGITRWAPMPDDPLRPPDTPSPPPLRRRSVVDDTESGAWMVVDLSVGGLSGSANNLPFLAPDHTLLSPFIVDPASLNRVRTLWRSLNPNSRTQDLPVSIKTVATAVKRDSGSAEERGSQLHHDDVAAETENQQDEHGGEASSSSASATTIQMTVAEIRLSDFVGHSSTGLAHVTHLVAQGKAPDRQAATVLAAMHLELILDASGFPLFPLSDQKQQQHAEAASQFGRPVGASNGVNFVCPPPLKGLHRFELQTNISSSSSSTSSSTFATNSSSSSSPSIVTSSNSTGEQWVARNVVLLSLDDGLFKNIDAKAAFDHHQNHHHHNAQDSTTAGTPIDDCNTNDINSHNNINSLNVNSPIDELVEFLCVSGESRPDPFLSIKMPDGRVRTAVVLPSVQGLSRNAIYGGIAEAANRKDSRLLAAQHALDVLNTLGVLVHPGDHDKQSAHEARRIAKGKVAASQVQDVQELPPPMRLIGLNFSPSSLGGSNNATTCRSPNREHDVGTSDMVNGEIDAGAEKNSTIFYDLPPPQEKSAANTATRSTTTASSKTTATTTTTFDFEDFPSSKSNCSDNDDDDDDHNHHRKATNTSQQQPLQVPSLSSLLDPNDQFIRTTQAPPHYWDMRPNTADGFILVEGKPVAATGASYSIASVRNIDPTARDRIGALAARVGKSAMDIVTAYTALTKENTVYYSTQIEVPGIPAERFGVRLAIGEAQDQRNSEILACMHAETILDRLGLPLYPYDDELQRKHAESARSLGRYAPLPGEESANSSSSSPTTLPVNSPPPLRMRALQQLVEVPAQPIQGRGSHYLQLPTELYNSPEALDPTSVARVQFYLRRHRRTVLVPDVFNVQDHHGVNVHVAVLHVPSSSSIDGFLLHNHGTDNNNNNSSKNNNTKYNNNSKCDSDVLQENYSQQTLGPPLSHQFFGRRTAVGVAEKRRDAEVLCFMHAEQIVDALGLPLFSLDSLQRKHAQRVSKLFGRRAVTFDDLYDEQVDDVDIADDHLLHQLGNNNNHNNNNSNSQNQSILNETVDKFYRKKSKKRNPSFTVNPETVVTPPALRLDVNAVVKPKVIPQPDEEAIYNKHDESLSSNNHSNNINNNNNNNIAFQAWQEYVRQAEAYSDQCKKCDRHSKLAADRVPRTGDALIDDALDEAEATEVHRDVRNHLISYCVKMNVEYSQNWSTVQIGTATIRKSFTRVPVPGFPHIEALGIANNKEMSMRKAAHHALHLLKRLDPDFYLFETEVLTPTAMSAGMMMMMMTTTTNASNASDEQQQSQTISTSSGSKNTRAVAAAHSALRSANDRQSSSRKNRGPDHGSYDRISGSFTTDGKIRLVNLYTLCNGLAAPVVSHREKVENGMRVQYTTVEVADLNGSRIIGWAQEGGKKTNEPAAYDDLVQTLLKRVPQFASLAKLLKTHPHLDPEHIVHLELPSELDQQLRTLLEEDQRQKALNDDHLSSLLVGGSAAQHDLNLLEAAEEKKEAEVAAKRADDLLSTLDVATSLLLKKSREATSMDPMASQRLNAFLKAKQKSREASKQYKEKFLARRESLSIFAKKQEILDTVRNNPVTVLCGTTGCGKTTQVPQYLLEREIESGSGSDSTIIVTQPRRISAISIAQRVAAERLEPIGQTVGYTVRLDSRPGSNINFCTSGVLLRLLQSSPTIDHVKYLIIDEIHERDINSDFLLILVKRLVQKRSDLRVILMSATLQSELFAGFFGGAPVINVEGYVYPCQELFLDELAQTCKEREIVTPSTKLLLEGKEEIASFNNNNNNNNNSNNGNSNVGDQLLFAADQQQQQRQNPNPNLSDLQHHQQQQQQDQQQHQIQKKAAYGTLEAPTEIDFPLIAFAIEHARKDFDLHGGSILVFLPGWEEITRIRDMFVGNPQYLVLPLHSSVSAEEQLKCFLPPPNEHTVKLILSTNIAESGVTIDDIGCVIDSGRAKEKTYLSRRGRTSVGRKEMGTMSQLVQVLASRANVTQRRGRVGRTRPGVCMKLYSRRQYDELPDFATPEILRQPLDALCLQIMALKLGDPLEFLSLALEPPPPQSIEAAMTRLFHLGAVNDRRQLSPLGLRLALLPVSPKVGKMILYGAALQCLDSALTLAACADVDPFVTQREMKELVKMSKQEFSANALSDPITNVNAYYSWVNSKITLPSDKVTELETNRCLSKLSLTTISKYKEQYYEILRQSGFLENQQQEQEHEHSQVVGKKVNENNIPVLDDVKMSSPAQPPAMEPQQQSPPSPSPSPSSASTTTTTTNDSFVMPPMPDRPKRQFFTNGEIFLELSPFSSHANSLPLLKALLCSGLFPNVALFRDKRRFRSKLQNMLHPFPASVVSKLEEDDVASPFFVYDEMVKTASDPRVFFRNITNCSVWAIILLGASGSHAHMEFRHDLNLAILDDWLVFRVTADALELIQHLKHKFLACIERKFLNPTDCDNNELLSKMQKIIQKLVSEPVRPNDLTTSLWEERGELVEVDVSRLLSEVDRVPLTPEQIAEKERKEREQVATETMEAADELKSDKAERDEEHRHTKIGLADDEEDN